MKKKILFIFSIFSFLFAAAQKTELYADAVSGMLGFRGKSAVTTSFINQSSLNTVPSYTNDQYSRTAKAGGGIFFSLQRTGKSGFIYGVAAGGEVLKNKVKIDAVANQTGGYSADGTSVFTLKFIDVAPYAGYRIHAGKNIRIDISGSIDLGFCIAPHSERGFAKANSGTASVYTRLARDKTGLDFRTGLQTRINYKRFSVGAGFWTGHSNYYKGYIGGSPEAHSQLLRISLGYCLLK